MHNGKILKAEGRERNENVQAVYKNRIIFRKIHCMKTLLTAILFLFCTSALTAQERNSERATVQIHLNQADERREWINEFVNMRSAFYGALNETQPVVMRLRSQKIPLTAIAPFLSFFCTWEDAGNDASNTTVFIRFSEDNLKWTDPIAIKPDAHVNEVKGRFIGELMFKEKQYQYYRAEIATNQSRKGILISKLYLNFFSAGDKPKTVSGRVAPLPQINNRVTACNVPQPSFVNRTGWGCTQVWGPSTTTVTHLIVHHAAGTNTSSDWGAVVLGIWNFHTTPSGAGGAGYSDIGYNWLIAPDGVLYEGRYNSSVSNITGAHFCGTNGNTMGVCMLGDYTNITISTAARAKLAQLLAWKACERNIDPLASSFHASSNKTIFNISGHRDGCATQCPGNTFYPDLPGVRIDVSNIINVATPVTSISGLEEFSISPNPLSSSAVLSLKLNTVKEMQYRIVTADGKVLYQSARQKITGIYREELKALNDLPAAAYLLQLWLNEEMVSKQLLKH